MLRALALTVLIECAAAWILGARTRRDQEMVALANLLTNPMVVSIGAAVSLIDYGLVRPVTLVMEAGVVIIEGVVYKKTIDIKTGPYKLSLICNLTSYLIGEVLNSFVF